MPIPLLSQVAFLNIYPVKHSRLFSGYYESGNKLFFLLRVSSIALGVRKASFVVLIAHLRGIFLIDISGRVRTPSCCVLLVSS